MIQIRNDVKKNNLEDINWKCNIIVGLKIGLFPLRSIKYRFKLCGNLFHVPSRIYPLFLWQLRIIIFHSIHGSIIKPLIFLGKCICLLQHKN